MRSTKLRPAKALPQDSALVLPVQPAQKAWAIDREGLSYDVLIVGAVWDGASDDGGDLLAVSLRGPAAIERLRAGEVCFHIDDAMAVARERRERRERRRQSA